MNYLSRFTNNLSAADAQSLLEALEKAIAQAFARGEIGPRVVLWRRTCTELRNYVIDLTQTEKQKASSWAAVPAIYTSMPEVVYDDSSNTCCVGYLFSMSDAMDGTRRIVRFNYCMQ